MIEAQATPTSDGRGTPRAVGVSGWRWALATLAVVALILGATFATHSIVARSRHPAATAAPALPPLTVLAVTSPDTDYELTALDTSLGHIVALAADRQPQCPPVGACPASPALDRFVILDGATGQVQATTPLTGSAAPAANAAFLFVDATRHDAYVVASQTVTIFSTMTGGLIGGYSLPTGASNVQPQGVAFDSANQRLLLLAGDTLFALDAATGAVLQQQSLGEAVGAPLGLALDARDGVLYTLRRGSGGQGVTLLAIDTTTLATVAQATLPTDASFGPLDPTTGAIWILGADGVTYRATFANGQISFASDGPANALALGWNAALGHTYVAHTDDVQALDASGKAVAALPVRIYGGAALLADPSRNLLYLSASAGSLIIAQDAAIPIRSTLSPATAILLARAALPNYLPDTNQDPPFLDAETFWPGASIPLASGGASPTRAENFWIHFSDRGWTGPYTGSAATSYTPLSGQPNSYQVTFTITWEQIFQRSHTWTLNVAPDGSVAYLSDSGDAVP